MSLTQHELNLRTWRNFPTIYALLKNSLGEFDSPLEGYIQSEYLDNIVDSSKAALENIGHLLDAYAVILENKDTLYVSNLKTVTPKLVIELTLQIESLKQNSATLSKSIQIITDELKKILQNLAPREYYRFKNEDVSDLGPFDSAQSIDFKNSFTLVIGDNCSGKTTIVNKLKSNFSSILKYPSGLYNLSFLIFISENELSNKSINPYELLETYGIEKESFDNQVNVLLEDLRSDLRCYARLIDKNYPCATGEVIMMNIVINFAVRKILRLDLPIVIDQNVAGVLGDYLNLFISFLRENCSQVLLLACPDRRYQEIGLNSDYYLNLDSKTKKTSILFTDKVR